MANAGPNTNGSQIFMVTSDCSYLNGQHVVFGTVKSQDDYKIVQKIESFSLDDEGNTSAVIKIDDCGIVDFWTEEELKAPGPK